jgi:hypothetical protein
MSLSPLETEKTLMASAWSQTNLLNGVQFSGWDPYSRPRGESLFDWFVVLSVVPALLAYFMIVDTPGPSVYCSAGIPLALYSFSARARSYRFTVSRIGYRLERSWFGFTWFDQSFPPGSLICLEEDFGELGIMGLSVCWHHFGRGKDAVQLVERIKDVAIEYKIWASAIESLSLE